MIVLNNIYIFSFKTSRNKKYISTKLSVLVAVRYGYANETEQSPKAWLGSRLLQGAGRRFTPPAYLVTEFLPPYTGIWFLLNKGFFR